MSRRQVLAGAGGTGLLRPPPAPPRRRRGRAGPGPGAPTALWSARRDTSTGYGIAVFDVDPAGSEAGGQASIKVTHYHAVGANPVNPATGAKGAPTPDYTEFETFRLVRSRSS